jgi:hypothetical protein
MCSHCIEAILSAEDKSSRNAEVTGRTRPIASRRTIRQSPTQTLMHNRAMPRIWCSTDKQNPNEAAHRLWHPGLPGYRWQGRDPCPAEPGRRERTHCC